MFQHILVPLDGSRLSSQAVPYAVRLAKRFESQLILLRVVPPARITTPIERIDGIPSPAATEMAVQSARLQDKKKLSKARRYLSRKVRDLATRGITSSYHISVGDPVQSIANYCHPLKIDLIVMATRGRAGLKRAIAGSVTDHLIRESGVPVLVIRRRTQKPKK